MAIEKNSFKVSRFDSEYQSPHSRDNNMSSDDEDIQRRNSVSAVESDGDDDDEFDDCDSGAGSDDFDLLELGETGEEFCRVGDQTCSIPFELYDLPGLKDVLSMEVWNDVLTEEERFGLAKYLPDMDQENFVHTLKELFSGDNLHFGSPIAELFENLKGGFCEPRVALYRQGLNFFKRKEHFHFLRKHHNGMVNNICQIRDTWLSCKGYSIEEKLRVLNIMKSQKSLMNENMEDFVSDSSDREALGDGLWGKKVKDRKLGQKSGQYSGHGMGVTSEISSRGQKTAMESAKRGKQNPKGTLKLAGSKITSSNEVADRFPLIHPGIEMKSGFYGLGLPLSRHNQKAGYGSSAAIRINEHITEDEDEDEDEEPMYEVAVQRDRNFQHVGAKSKTGTSKFGKKHEGPRSEEKIDSFTGLPMSAKNNLHAFGRNKAINQLSDIKVLTTKPSNVTNVYDGDKKKRFPPGNQMKFGKGQKLNLTLKGSQKELLDGSDPLWLSKSNGEHFHSDLSYLHSDLNAKNQKLKVAREAIDLNINDKLLHADYRNMSLRDKFPASFQQNGKRERAGNRGIRAFGRSEETESDSSEQMDDDEDDNPLMRSKWAYPSGEPDLKYSLDMKKTKLAKKDSYLTLDGSSRSSRKMEDHGVALETMNAEHKGNVINSGDRQQFYPLGRNGHLEGDHGDSSKHPPMKPSITLERRLKGETCRDLGVSQLHYKQDYNVEDDLFWTRSSTGHHPERSDAALMGCNTFSKKRKIKDGLAYMNGQDNNQFIHADTQLLHDDVSSSRKRGKNKFEDTFDVLEKAISEQPSLEMVVEDTEAETKPQKKPFPLITPTILTGFSFSIVHLLSAVRMAMITLLPEDSLEAGKNAGMSDAGQGVKEEQGRKQEDINAVNSNLIVEGNTSVPSQANVPCLTVQEVVNRVRSNPGDPCILETQEPLLDLVRGVLKIFSSRTAPLGAKGWKPLVIYEKSIKSWSWIGPVPHTSSDTEAVEEVTSPDAWNLPHKMLVKLVDSFANWLKNSQDTLQQIGSLPAPPLMHLLCNLDEKERFKDLRAQKSLSTISQSSEEVRTYFRKEEVLRYLIPDRAFSYTAVDGKKSIVAPLRRCGGKPTSKARDHFMLKRDRPPHVTILCLVRDAAARLPGSIGTRADVCTLIRDSQYVVEDVSDAQVNQVVSGALDRLHYERDPCVQFDGERKLWVYLHREREEEDFEDDGTSSTKKWRRQKKETTEPPDQGDVTVAYPGPVGQSGFDSVSDLNVEASCADDDKNSEIEYHNGNDLPEDNIETSHCSDRGMHPDPTPVMWDGFGLNSAEGNRLICQENSTNEDFDESTFVGEPPA